MLNYPIFDARGFARCSFCIALTIVLTVANVQIATAEVIVVKTPHDGIQPQAAIDSAGVLHLLYYQGDAYAGDLYYVQSPLTKKTPEFSKPVRVNSEPGTAVAAGTVRGGQLALGKNNRVHVAWNGSSKAKGPHGSAMCVTRATQPADAKTPASASAIAFEPQQNLMTRTALLDGGGSIAVDAAGNVYVAWHAALPDDKRGEQQRQVWIARSTDEGKTFAAESPAIPKNQLGACACCGLRAFADRDRISILYRAAETPDQRDIHLLSSTDHGASFTAARLDPWKLNACPMSTMSLAASADGLVAAWETDGAIRFAAMNSATAGKPGKPTIHTVPAGKAKQHHPAIAVNNRGELLIAWAEGTAWQRGGALAYQVFAKDGEPTKTAARIDAGIPVWSLPTAAAHNADFIVVH